MTGIRNINLGLETIKVHEKYFEIQDKRINEKINTLNELNNLLRTLAEFTATLNSGKNNKDALDFTNHPQMRSTIDTLYLKYPELFTGHESNIYGNWDQKRIENVTFGADPHVKQLSSEVTQLMTRLQVDYTDQAEITRILGKMIEEIIQHTRSILSKLSKIAG